MAILVTGGAGYIGSHTCIELLNAGNEIVVIDNFSNSDPKTVELVKELSGKDFKFYEADMLDGTAVERIFSENDIDTVIHFAGVKSPNESVSYPLKYYSNNITGTLILAETMRKYNCKKIVFSSSAAVYGTPPKVPVTENSPLSPINPYGRTKLFIEQILNDLYVSDNDMSIAVLRYFNPIGAHKSGKIGECPVGTPNNILPSLQQVALGKIKELQIFGNDYPTPDGTGIRDYIHISDLVHAHIKAAEKLGTMKGVGIWNIGTGKGYSVLEIIRAFSKASGIDIPFVYSGRRAGDPAECYADTSKALAELDWKAGKDLDEMCEDAWRFAQTLNN